MAGRTIAIGDVHGCPAALAALVEAIAPAADDTIVCLGDYIDRGPNSREVLDQVIALAARCRLIPLLGNHEEMILAALADPKALESWLRNGGVETVRSYGWVSGGPRRRLAELIPQRHREFLAGCRAYHETQTHLFVHAGYLPHLAMEQQPGVVLRCRVTDAKMAEPHCSGKVAVVGHTPQRSGEVLDLGFLVCIDTNCNRGGWLTALDVNSGQIHQADAKGRLRKR
jgi:serine/threonine protein phosphatase 1